MAKAPKLLNKHEDNLAWNELEPLAKWVRESELAKKRKAWAELLKFITREIGRPVVRSGVEKWLSANPETRVIPNFGFGLVLLKARKKFCGR